MSETSDNNQGPSSLTNVKPSITLVPSPRNQSGDQGKSMLPPSPPVNGPVAHWSYNYLGSYTMEDPNAPGLSNLGPGDLLPDSNVNQNQDIEAATDFVFAHSRPTGPSQHGTPQFTNPASFNYQGRSNIAEMIPYIQSTGMKTRVCDRCYENQWDCNAWRMPCPQCKDDQVQCTDDRPRRAYNVAPSGFLPGSGVGYNQNEAVEARNTLVSTRSATTTEFNQYETQSNTLAVNHQYQWNTFAPPPEGPLRRDCDRCFRNGWNCSLGKLPCYRCKKNQVHCTNDRPMYQPRDEAQACYMQGLADADGSVGTNSTRVG